MTTFKIRLNGKETEIEASRQGDRLRVTYEGKSADLRLLHTDGSSFVLEWELPNGTRQRIRAIGRTDGDKRQMWVNGRTFSYERLRQRKAQAVDERANALSASIPAVVSEVLVKIDQQVQQGDKLILLESMKMVIPIQAPAAGRIIRINCAAGDAVQPNVQLIELEELEA